MVSKKRLLDAVLVLGCVANAASARATEPERTVLTIPATASVVGVNGNAFHSDVWLFNRSSLLPVFVELRYRCLGGWECSPEPKTLALAPRQSVVLEDFVAALFQAPGTAGPLEVSFTAGGPISVASRVTTTSAAGTFGTSVPALPASAARFNAVFVGVSASGGDLSRGARSNAGVYNPNSGSADVTFTLLDDHGRRLGAKSLTLAPSEAVQLYPNIFDAVGATSVDTRKAVLEVTATAPVFSYVTVIDNASGDSVFLTSDADDRDGGGPVAGAWTGTFEPWDYVDCFTSGTPASARFEQDGENVVGVLDTRASDCGFQSATFRGVLRNGALKGTVSGEGGLSAYGPADVTGTLSDSTLRIEIVVHCPGVLCIPGGRLVLHR
jgi:hypothetical protein